MGIAAIQVGKALGATVIAAASSDSKLSVCKSVGADYLINYTTQDMKKEVEKITSGNFVDVVYENVGGDIFHQCVRCMAGGGRLLVIGFASGEIPKLPVNLPLIKGFSLIGVRSGAEMARDPQMTMEMIMELLKLTKQGKLKPFVHSVVPPERAQEAFQALSNRTVTGKAVICFGAPTSSL
eukprot:TRINITY_DN9564_c0_g1_i2.p1 TRINITY_DN9564_c0_g1~~TRINITY_DN9564_c0_g1_i2.p1  ORF type:complete len:204 (-),score=63.32 TRINITY_DN9564_c0_g1_i2:151-693(-)